MNGTKLLFSVGQLSSRHQFSFHSLRLRSLLHTCSPWMNQDKSTNKKEPFNEQPHMRIMAKAAAKEKGMLLGESQYKSIFFHFSSRSDELHDVS